MGGLSSCTVPAVCTGPPWSKRSATAASNWSKVVCRGGGLSPAPLHLPSEQQQVASGFARLVTPFHCSAIVSFASPSPPSSGSQQAGGGLIKNIRTFCAEQVRYDNEGIDAGEGGGAEADGSGGDHVAQPHPQRRTLQRRGPGSPPTSGAVQGKYIYYIPCHIE